MPEKPHQHLILLLGRVVAPRIPLEIAPLLLNLLDRVVDERVGLVDVLRDVQPLLSRSLRQRWAVTVIREEDAIIGITIGTIKSDNWCRSPRREPWTFRSSICNGPPLSSRRCTLSRQSQVVRARARTWSGCQRKIEL